MLYNYDFLIASVCIIICILVNFNNEKKSEILEGRIFLLIVCLSVVDIFLDILTSVLLEMNVSSFSVLTEVSLVLFFMAQTIMPYALLAYAYSLQGEKDRTKAFKKLTIFFIPIALLCLIVLTNVFTHAIFYFDEVGNYLKGPLYYSIYINALVYGIIVLVTSILHFKELGSKRFFTLCEYFIIEMICVIIQAFHSSQLVTGFAIALGVLVFALTFNNPLSYTDNLTGAFDMRYFMQWFRNAHSTNKKYHIVIVEIIRLRQINEVYGASFGDVYIKSCANLFLSYTENVFRLGNRFILALDDDIEYREVMVRLKRLKESGIEIQGSTIGFSPIVCAIENGTKYENYDYLISYIDYLINQFGKKNGTDIIISNQATEIGYENEKEIERYIQVAINENLFEVYFQPIYSFENHCYITMEALSRLKHPTLGFISPDLFISIAEKNGLVAEIGVIQLKKCCEFARNNPEVMDKIKSIKFNLSPVEIIKPGHFERLMSIMNDYGVDHRFIEFEITETVATEYTRSLITFIENCQKYGIKLSLDDFGSGYANLNSVLRLPFSTIKLDKSLLNGLSEDENVAKFYQSIVSVLKSLNYRIVAEGVETKDEVNLLKQWNVDMIQGYYFSKPLNQKDIIREINQIKTY